MTYLTPDAIWAVVFEETSGLHGRATWFIRRFPATNGPALWAAFVSDRYLPGDLPLRALTRVSRLDTDLVRVHRLLPCGSSIHFSSAALRRNSLSEAFCAILTILSYVTLPISELYLDLCLSRTLAESALGISFCDVLPHLGRWRGFIDVSPLALLHYGRLLPYAYRTLKNTRSSF